MFHVKHHIDDAHIHMRQALFHAVCFTWNIRRGIRWGIKSVLVTNKQYIICVTIPPSRLRRATSLYTREAYLIRTRSPLSDENRCILFRQWRYVRQQDGSLRKKTVTVGDWWSARVRQSKIWFQNVANSFRHAQREFLLRWRQVVLLTLQFTEEFSTFLFYTKNVIELMFFNSMAL